jgi:hypothetical protein
MTDTLKKVEKWLREARDKNIWGELQITVKDGSPILIKTTTQTKPQEDYPCGFNQR